MHKVPAAEKARSASTEAGGIVNELQTVPLHSTQLIQYTAISVSFQAEKELEVIVCCR